MSYCVVPDAVVPSKDLAVGVHYVSALGLNAQKIRVASAVEILALRMSLRMKAKLHIYFAHLFLGHLPKRKEGRAKLSLAESIEKVALVLDGVNSPLQAESSVLFLDSGIVACCELVELQPRLPCILHHCPELDLLVAPDAGIRCVSTQILFSEVPQNR